MKITKNNKLKNSISSSFFISILNKISDFFYGMIISCKAAKLFCSYDNIEEKSRGSFVKRVLNRITPNPKAVLKAKNLFAKKIENSLFYKVYKKLVSHFLGAKAKLHGIFLIVYGLSSSCVGFVEKYAFRYTDESSSLITQGIILIALSLPLLFAKSSIYELLVSGKISSAVIRFLDIKCESVKNDTTVDNTAIPVILALLCGFGSFVFEPIYFLLLFIALAVVCIIFHRPELGVLLTVTLLPFTPTMVICAEIILVWFAFLLKVARGKRSLKLSVLDFVVLLFSLFMLFGGVFSVTPSKSIMSSCVFICFISFYFIIVNLVRTTELSYKLLSCSLFSCTICSLYGIYQNFFSAPDTTWTDEDMFSEIETRVVSTFENPNVFGEYLIMLIPVALALLITSKRLFNKASYFACFGVSLLALVYTWSRGAWLGCIASMIIFMVIISKRAISFYLLGIFALPVAIPMLPNSILDRFSSIGNMTDSSTSYRVFIWEASVKMIKDFLFTGIGIGTSAFQTVYSEYALAGIETAPHSHNLYLQVLVETGIFGFLTFVSVVLLFLTKVFSFLKKNNSLNKKIIIGSLTCGIIAFLVQGFTDYVWYNYRVFGMFWIIVAMCVALVNSYSNEIIENTESV